MPQGLQIFDASGNIIFDTSNAIGRVLGVANVVASTSGTVTNDGLTTGRPFWIFQTTTTQYFSAQPTVTASSTSNVLSWNTGSSTNGIIIYGVY